MESEHKNSYLFYFIITLILLGFIASLALPLKAQEHRLSDAGMNSRTIPWQKLKGRSAQRAPPPSAPRDARA
jgi:hypothetical protein